MLMIGNFFFLDIFPSLLSRPYFWQITSENCQNNWCFHTPLSSERVKRKRSAVKISTLFELHFEVHNLSSRSHPESKFPFFVNFFRFVFRTNVMIKNVKLHPIQTIMNDLLRLRLVFYFEVVLLRICVSR